ncbi:MAG: PEGA domain-containing protein [Candidatus Sungbacteria bacterium]|nr:PEGA domain-containing protein [Candidatus Sungbacteria bacterium]
MTLQTRRILFFLLLVVFVILAPLMVIYSLGLTIDFNKKTFVETGSIFIKSKTPQTSVFLNGALVKQTSFFSGSALLTGVAPGTYVLRIEKDGYQPWSRIIAVLPALVTELRNTLLVQDRIDIATSSLLELGMLKDATSSPLRTQLTLSTQGVLSERVNRTKLTLASHVHAFGIVNNRIYVIDTTGGLERINPVSGEVETLGNPGLSLASTPIRFFGSPNNDVSLLDASGDLFLYQDGTATFATLSRNVAQPHFDLTGQKILFIKGQEIRMIWLDDNHYQPFQKKWTEEKIIRLSSPIRDALWWYGDSAHIVFRTRDGIFLTELDGRGGRSTVEIYSNPLDPGRNVGVDEILTIPDAPNSIFFRQNKTWHTITL